MWSLRNGAIQDYNNVIDSLKKVAGDTDIQTRVTVAEFNNRVRLTTINTLLEDVQTIRSYQADGGTALFDAVSELVNSIKEDGKSTYLIMAITDGQENQSKMSSDEFGRIIRHLQKTDRWTFVFRVPRGYRRNLTHLGIPEGNILEWDQTETGLRESTVLTAQSLGGYYTNVSRGIGSTQTFYTDLSKTSADQVAASMDNISKEVAIYTVTDERPDISSFVTKMTGRSYLKGSAFYQLVKPEKAVQDYKLIVVRNKKNGAVYYGKAARQILGLPTQDTIKLIPKNHGNWDIYIQSTSSNRVLPPGTQLLYWKAVR